MSAPPALKARDLVAAGQCGWIFDYALTLPARLEALLGAWVPAGVVHTVAVLCAANSLVSWVFHVAAPGISRYNTNIIHAHVLVLHTVAVLCAALSLVSWVVHMAATPGIKTKGNTMI